MPYLGNARSDRPSPAPTHPLPQVTDRIRPRQRPAKTAHDPDSQEGPASPPRSVEQQPHRDEGHHEEHNRDQPTAAHLPTDVVLLAGLHRVRQVEHLARAEIHGHALLRVSHATRRLPRCAGPNPPYACGGRVIASTSRAAARSARPISTNPRSSTAWRTVT